MPFKAVVSDGWTGHSGTVTNITEFGVFVNFGCEKHGLLPRKGSQAVDAQALESLSVGDRVTVYVVSKQLDTRKINLSLVPRQRPNHMLTRIIADGRTPYPAVVANISAIGTFFDMGAEQQAFYPASDGGHEHPLKVGDHATIYVVGKRKNTGKLHCALLPDTETRQSWKELVTDGQTPYRGVVTSVSPDIGAFIDLGCDTSAMLPARTVRHDGRADEAKEDEERVLSLQPGEEITVYVTHYTEQTNKVSVSLEPLPRPQMAWKDVMADGQTRYEGVIVNKTAFGAFVDFGCAHRGLLPANRTEDAAFASLRVGQKLPVYVYTKSPATGKISLRLTRSSRPRERWEAVLSDGQTPYEGIVISNGWAGAFVDMHCENDGCIPSQGASADPRVDELQVGDKVTVYIVEKRRDVGHAKLSLERLDTALVHFKDLVADGQTPYDGKVTAVNAHGAVVSIGSDTSGLIPRHSPEHLGRQDVVGTTATQLAEEQAGLEVGAEVRVYIHRRNPTNGRMVLALQPTAVPRMSLDDALHDRGKSYYAVVYSMEYRWALLDFGCEVSGCLSRNEGSPDLAVGSGVFVSISTLDMEKGRFVVVRARPPPPPRPDAA